MMVLPSSSSFMATRSMQQFTLPLLSLLLYSLSHLPSNYKCAVKFTNNISIPIFGYFQFISTNDCLKILLLLHQMYMICICISLQFWWSSALLWPSHVHTYICTYTHKHTHKSKKIMKSLWKNDHV